MASTNQPNTTNPPPITVSHQTFLLSPTFHFFTKSYYLPPKASLPSSPRYNKPYIHISPLIFTNIKSKPKSSLCKYKLILCQPLLQLKDMRERMERLVGFPFSVSCVSQASVDVLESGPTRRSKSERAPSTLSIVEARDRDQAKLMTKGLSGAINISAGIHKAVMKGIKSFSQLFYEREREDEFDIKEIGYPTDVQHLAHVGADGSSLAGLDAMDGCGRAPDQLSFFLPPLALRQFELALNHA